MSYLERPNHSELYKTAGYVHDVRVEQEDARDQLQFTLAEYLPWGDDYIEFLISYSIYPDVGTTVALSQMKLLQDSMEKAWPVEIHYHPSEDSDLRHVYSVRLFTSDEVATLTQYFDEPA